MPEGQRIEVTGLRELRRALRQAEGRSPQELRKAGLDAAKAVVPEARRRAPKGKHEGGGKVEPAAASIKARATAGRAYIVFGGTRSPHEPVINFGGVIPRRGVTVTHVRRREHIYAVIEGKRQDILHAYEQAIGRITKDL